MVCFSAQPPRLSNGLVAVVVILAIVLFGALMATFYFYRRASASVAPLIINEDGTIGGVGGSGGNGDDVVGIDGGGGIGGVDGVDGKDARDANEMRAVRSPVKLQAPTGTASAASDQVCLPIDIEIIDAAMFSLFPCFCLFIRPRTYSIHQFHCMHCEIMCPLCFAHSQWPGVDSRRDTQSLRSISRLSSIGGVSTMTAVEDQV
jgi:hypothetical protein